MDNQNYIILRNSDEGDVYKAAHKLDDKVDELKAKLDEKDKEIEALREFAKKVLPIRGLPRYFDIVLIKLAMELKLIDEYEKPINRAFDE